MVWGKSKRIKRKNVNTKKVIYFSCLIQKKYKIKKENNNKFIFFTQIHFIKNEKYKIRI